MAPNVTFEVGGVDGPINIVFDSYGIPHIKATTTHDAFFGQGYCQGKERLFQIELYRRMASGTASEMMVFCTATD